MAHGESGMSTLACGIDFGTSNTTAALATSSGVRAVPFDPASTITDSGPTLLYFDEDGHPAFASAAIAAYVSRELQGRLVQAIKRYLPSPTFEGTWIGGRLRTIEELVGGYLHYVRAALESDAGAPVSRVVLGRPARFHDDDARDQLAQDRLERAARIAGFEEIRFQVEPIAAARRFEEGLERAVLCLVGDLGGGTSDFSVVRLSPRAVGRSDRVSDVRGVSGVSLAGNDLDARLIMRFVLPAFGYGTTYAPVGQTIPFPTSLHMAMTRWHRLCLAGTDAELAFLRRGIRTAADKAGLRRLHELLSERYAWQLFRAVEDAKLVLSQADAGTLSLHQGGIQLDLDVDRAGFEDAIQGELAGIAGCMDRLLADLDLRPADIGVVFLTGGTSKVPAVQALFEQRFPGRIVPQDAFTSVGYGLGVEAAEAWG